MQTEDSKIQTRGLAFVTANPIRGLRLFAVRATVQSAQQTPYLFRAIAQLFGFAVVGNFELIDILWVNTGIVVTTTTAQTITMPGALPARDNNGATNGAGIMAALYTTTANTNAAVVANSTLSYTDQDGNAGNTATFSGVVGFQAPATPVVGTWMPFILAAGDSGIRSVQSITLGTSYGAGALSLVLYRSLDREGVSVANTSSGALNGPDRTIASPGVRVYNDTCFALVATGAPATTAAGVYGGTIQLMDR